MSLRTMNYLLLMELEEVLKYNPMNKMVKLTKDPFENWLRKMEIDYRDVKLLMNHCETILMDDQLEHQLFH